jgi:hypothetical protein
MSVNVYFQHYLSDTKYAREIGESNRLPVRSKISVAISKEFRYNILILE